MSDRPTLETDNIARGNHVVPTEWAQRLERERDEAKIDAQKSKAYKRVLKETNLRQTERIRYLEGATNHAEGTPLSIALKERDEAVNELHDIRLNLGADAEGYTLVHAVCVLQQERDEAREALMKIEDLFIDGTDIYADREKMGMIAREALEDAK
jgi:hypothetical protein